MALVQDRDRVDTRICRYKAGALSYGMKLFGDSIDYVAVFDSDFQPSPSFLRDLVPYLVANPTVGWVQVGEYAMHATRWSPLLSRVLWWNSRRGQFCVSAEAVAFLLAAEPLDLHEPR